MTSINPSTRSGKPRSTHKHKLRVKRGSRKTLFFICKECGRVRGYRRYRVHELVLGIGRPYFRTLDRSN